MAKLLATENFQYRGPRRKDTVLDVADAILLEEIELGVHDNKLYGKKRWISGLLNHCIPANDATMKLIASNLPDGVKAEELDLEPAVEETDEQDDSQEIANIRDEFERMGKSYDKRWGLKRLQNELTKARKMTGTGPAPAVSEA